MSSFTDRALRFLKTTKKPHDGDVNGDDKQHTQLTKSQLTSKNIEITKKNTKIDEVCGIKFYNFYYPDTKSSIFH
jgi:hypothetical protein